MFADLVYECRGEILGSLGESVIKDLLSNPDVHVAGVKYHKAAAAKATDPRIKARHERQIRHHSKEAERLRRRSKGREEGAGDPDLHARSVRVLRKAKEQEEYGSPGQSGVGAY